MTAGFIFSGCTGGRNKPAETPVVSKPAQSPPGAEMGATPASAPEPSASVVPTPSNVVNMEGESQTEFFGTPVEKFEAMEYDLLTSLRNEPNDEKNLLMLAQLYLKQRKYDRGEETAKKLISINPESVGAYLVLADSYRDRKHYKEAEEALKKSIEFNDKVEKKLKEAPAASAAAEDVEEPETLQDKIKECKEQKVSAYTALGKVCYQQMKYEAALEYNGKALKLDPGRQEAYIIRSEIFKAQGKFDDAEKTLQKLLEIDPGNETAKKALGTVREVNKKTEGAPLPTIKGVPTPESTATSAPGSKPTPSVKGVSNPVKKVEQGSYGPGKSKPETKSSPQGSQNQPGVTKAPGVPGD